MYKLEVTEQEVVTIGRALSAMPYAEVSQLMPKLQKQVNEQGVQNGDAERAEPQTVE